jgi:PTH1 family peptidyl-tRNA hydrolase
MNDELKLIVGLGNPGREYEKTRHNVGAWVVQALSRQYSVDLHQEARFFGSFGKLKLSNHECMLLIPGTFMNLSGQAVSACASYYKIPTTSILVVHDDLDFVPGVIKLKYSGGHGGHRGLQDIITRVGSKDFYRLRIGIGHPGHKDFVSDYVLSCPKESEREVIVEGVDRISCVISDLIGCGKFTGSEFAKFIS